MFSFYGAMVSFTIYQRGCLWGTAETDQQTLDCASFQAFTGELWKVFREMSVGLDATGELQGMSQGARTFTEYAIDFCTRTRQSDWNIAAQCDAFLMGLGDYIKDELVFHDMPSSLDGLIKLTSW